MLRNRSGYARTDSDGNPSGWAFGQAGRDQPSELLSVVLRRAFFHILFPPHLICCVEGKLFVRTYSFELGEMVSSASQ